MKTFTAQSRSEVDMRVSQEIKNHQDSIYQVNQAINSLSGAVANLSLRMEKISSQAASDNKQTLILFENLEKAVQEHKKSIEQRVRDIETTVLALQDGCIEFERDIESSYANREEVLWTISPQVSRISNLEKDLSLSKECCNRSLHILKEQLKTLIQDLRKELTPSIPDIDPVQEKITDRLKVAWSRFESLDREIEILKKNVHYGEKKFENIYTLIERLKAVKP